MSETMTRRKTGDAGSAITILITGLLAAAIQFGLGIWGWGGWTAFFAHPALRVLAWVTVFFILLATCSGSSA